MKLSNRKLLLKRKYVKLFYLFSLLTLLLVTPLVIIQSQQKTQLQSKAAYDEPACTAKGGSCQDGFPANRSDPKYRGTQGAECQVNGGAGHTVFDLCPNQPEPVRCCVPNGSAPPPPAKPPPAQPPGGAKPPPGNDSACNNAGGQCQSNATIGYACTAPGGRGSYQSGKCLSNSSSSYLCCLPNGVAKPLPAPDCSKIFAPGCSAECPYNPSNGTCKPGGAPAPIGPNTPGAVCEKKDCIVMDEKTCNANLPYCTWLGSFVGKPGDPAPAPRCNAQQQYRRNNNNEYAYFNCKAGTKSATMGISASLQGIGPNATVQNPQQTATVKIFEGAGALTAAKYTAQDKITYDSASGKFVNPAFNLGTIPDGDYQMVIQIDKYLDKQVTNTGGSNVLALKTDAPLEAAPVEMKAGDVAPLPHGDNFVDIIDYNALVGCMPGAPADACINKKFADINDDGKVDQTDLDILKSNFGELGFSFQISDFKCEPDPACNSGKGSLQLCTLVCTKKTQRS